MLIKSNTNGRQITEKNKSHSQHKYDLYKIVDDESIYGKLQKYLATDPNQLLIHIITTPAGSSPTSR